MKHPLRKTLAAALILSLMGALLWHFSPFPAVYAIANLSDPVKLATLGKRGANSRLNKIVYWIADARGKMMPAEIAIGMAQLMDWVKEPQASLVKAELLRNLKIADELGLLTSENRERLRRGHAATITRGPYSGETVEIDHIVPISLAPEVGNELANLEMLPRTINRGKSNHVNQRQLDHAGKLLKAGLLTKESFERLRAKAKE